MPASTDTSMAGLQALADARALTDALFDYVRPDCFYQRPIPERHRVAFYRGHLEAFDANLIARRHANLPPFHAGFDQLFAFGIDPGPSGLPADKASDWPESTAIMDYMLRSRETVDELWEAAPEQLRWVALEHRLMHAETLAYMLHSFPTDRLVAPAGTTTGHATTARVPHATTVEIPAGAATLGRSRSHGFGWDNEFEEHRVSVPAFSISKYKVTNGEYLDFLRTGAPAPHFWVQHGDRWYLRCMFAEIPLPLDWPVYVTQEQAVAYATWMGQDLPTEAEWHRAACGGPDGVERPFPWGGEEPWEQHGNFDFHRWDPVPVDATPQGDSAFGVSQMTGNGWEWTSTVFEPFAGFRPFDFYPGYSADFFDGEHYVLKGASPRTARVFARRSFRNWFRPHYPYIYAGFRCVER